MVAAPLVKECAVNIECRVADTRMDGIPRLNRNPAEEASQNREFGFDWGDDSSEFSFS
jgi:hypothetical protein